MPEGQITEAMNRLRSHAVERLWKAPTKFGFSHILTAELAQVEAIVRAAYECVNNPAWAGVCDEDLKLEQAVNKFINKENQDG